MFFVLQATQQLWGKEAEFGGPGRAAGMNHQGVTTQVTGSTVLFDLGREVFDQQGIEPFQTLGMGENASQRTRTGSQYDVDTG